VVSYDFGFRYFVRERREGGREEKMLEKGKKDNRLFRAGKRKKRGGGGKAQDYFSPEMAGT